MSLKFRLTTDGNAIVQLTDIGLIEDDALYNFGMELDEDECRQVLKYIVDNYETTDNIPDEMETILKTLFPDKYQKGRYGVNH